MKKIIALIIFLVLWILWLSTSLLIKFQLNNSKHIYIEPNTNYIEYGAKAFFFGKRLSIKVIKNINIHKAGKYYVHYIAKNSFGISKKIKRIVVVKDRNKPIIKLNGSRVLVLKKSNFYQELGSRAYDLEDGNISYKIKIKGNINPQKLGTYKLKYIVKDKSNNENSTIRKVIVIDNNFSYKDTYNNIDNTLHGWGHNNKRNHIRPITDVNKDVLDSYNAYSMGDDKKIIYLTFDEGSNETYLKEIVDILNIKNIKATFFLCEKYMIDNKEVVKKMVKKGHIIGNHTKNHKVMPSLATKENYKKYVNELKSMERAYKKITGKDMLLLYRPPAGDFSYRSLKLAQDMGYRTYFWSAAYLDYMDNLSCNNALKELMSLYHNGAIYLLHPKNKGNYLALSQFIDNMKELGYIFDTIDNI